MCRGIFLQHTFVAIRARQSITIVSCIAFTCKARSRFGIGAYRIRITRIRGACVDQITRFAISGKAIITGTRERTRSVGACGVLVTIVCQVARIDTTFIAIGTIGKAITKITIIAGATR